VAGSKNGRSKINTQTIGGLKGFELLTDLSQDALADALTIPVINALEGGAPPPGGHPVVLDPSLAGVLVHEALGHFLEGDLVIDGTSPLKDKMGECIAHDDFTLVDDPTVRGVGSYAYDDEGCQGTRTPLIEKGYLTHMILNRQTAAELGEISTGNGRAEDHRQLPLVRMSNTILLPGEWGLEELLEDTRDGVYLTGCISGNVTPSTGTFTFTAQGGYQIADGQLGEPIAGATITGHIEDVLFNISAIGCDTKMQANSCVKNNQNVLVGCGSPHIRVEKLQMR
jgi:TldD protein